MKGLHVVGVSHAYGDNQVLDNASLMIPAGELVCLLGPSGSGKTTLMRLAAGLERLQQGKILIDDEVVAGGERLRALVSPLFPFQTECKRMEGSPGKEDASILWACLDKQSGEVLGLLRRALEQELEKIGIPYDERPFKPRLMLGRARDGKNQALLETLERFEDRGFGASTIKDLVLFAVTQDADGVNYRVVNRFLLGEN